MGANPTAQVEVLGHSLGGYLSLQIANGLVQAAQNSGVPSAVSDLDQHLSVRTYDAVGIPGMTPEQSANLNPITTNWRDVVPGAAGVLSNGMSAGDIVSTFFNPVGAVVQVPATADTINSVIDLHSTGALGIASINLTALTMRQAAHETIHLSL